MNNKTAVTLQIKNKLTTLIGRPLVIKIHKGRKRYVQMEGYVDKVYNNIFTIASLDSNNTQSFSFADLITNDVCFIKFVD